MPEKPRKRSLLQPMLVLVAAVLMVAMFASSVVCVAFAYRTWSSSVVKVHRGLRGPQKRYTHLSDEQKDRIHTLAAGAVGSAMVGVGILATLRRRASGLG
jgi:hypothetical protein